MLSHAQARTVYDQLGAKQDAGAYYEDPPLANLLHHGRWEAVNNVLEFGCGTGSFAQKLLGHHLPATAHYLGMDQSRTMVQLAASRLADFGSRATVLLSGGPAKLLAADHTLDCVVSNYVLDLLAVADIQSFLAEAHRVLRPEGSLCLAGLTHGTTPLSRLVMAGWQLRYQIKPTSVGGCRPMRLTPLLDRHLWRLRHYTVVTVRGLASEVLIATAQPMRRE